MGRIDIQKPSILKDLQRRVIFFFKQDLFHNAFVFATFCRIVFSDNEPIKQPDFCKNCHIENTELLVSELNELSRCAFEPDLCDEKCIACRFGNGTVVSARVLERR